MSAVSTVLYVGSSDGALAVADALSTDAVTVLAVSDADAVSRSFADDRIDCVVCADSALVDAVVSARETAPDHPVIAYGVTLDDATRTVGVEDGVDELARAVEASCDRTDAPPVAPALDSATGLRQVLERIDDGFFALDTDWRFTYFNSRAAEMVGRDPETVVGETLWEVFPNLVGSTFEAKYREAMQTQEPTTFEAYFAPLEAWYSVTAYPAASGLSVYFRDVTERKTRERDRQRKTRALEAAPVGVTISDPTQDDNPLVFVNEAFTALTGYEPADALGRNCRFLQGPDTDPETIARMRAAIDAGEPIQVDVQNYRADGTPFWNRVDIAPVRDEAGSITNFVGFQRDVTDRKERQRRLRALTETSNAMMLAGTDDEVVRLAVAAADDVLGLPWTTVWRYNEAEDAFTSVARSDAAAERFGDTTLPVRTGETDQLSARDTPIWSAFVDGEVQVIDGSDDEPYSDGLSLHSCIVVPLSDFGVVVTGSPEPEAFVDRDVDLFRVLATSIEAALVRAKRERELQRQIARLDEFVSVVSHDLRNPLQVAQARLETYRTTGDETHLDHVADSHDRMRRLIDDVLTLAREGKAVESPEQVTLATVALQAWEAIDAPDATLETPTSATLVADPDRLRRLFENLFRNAVEHGGSDVTVRIDTLSSGFYVEDDGPGIPADERETVFEKGYTTSQDGTGFGLGIVRGIAEAHGWTVTATESESGGARFEVTGISTLS